MPVLRIIAGAAKGRQLATPEGRRTRPTSERAREALFSAVESEIGPWTGRRFLDLYCGSGAVGLEAVSRGAAEVHLVESDAKAAAVVRRNLQILGAVAADAHLNVMKASVYASRASGAFDVVFADPPYDTADDALAEVLLCLRRVGAIESGTLVVIERSSHDPSWSWPAGIEAISNRTYGEARFWYGRGTGEDAA